MINFYQHKKHATALGVITQFRKLLVFDKEKIIRISKQFSNTGSNIPDNLGGSNASGANCLRSLGYCPDGLTICWPKYKHP